jgi:hypothetical protein
MNQFSQVEIANWIAIGSGYVLRDRHGYVGLRDGPRFVPGQGLGRCSNWSWRRAFPAKSMVALAKAVSAVDTVTLGIVSYFAATMTWS